MACAPSSCEFTKTIADMLHDIDGEESTGFKEKYATDPSAFCKLA
jgi:hypothetical protein